MKLFATSLCVMWSIPLLMGAKPCSYKLSGTIKDAQNEQFLEHVTIRLNDNKYVTESDNDGHFHFNNLCDGKYLVECSFIGFKTFRDSIDLEHIQNIHIKLSPITTQLGEVTIKELLQKKSGVQSKELISSSFIQQNSGQSLGELLRNVNGLNTLQTGPSIFKPIIHGMHSNRLAIINAGVKQEGQQWGMEHAPELDPFGVNEITIIKGSAALEYGSSAIGGVIVANPERFHFDDLCNYVKTSHSYSSNGRGIQNGAKLQYFFSKKWAMRFVVNSKYTGDTHTPNYYLNNTGIRELNGSLHTAYQNQNIFWELYGSSFYNQLGILSSSQIGNISDLQNAINRGEPSIQKGFSYSVDRPYQVVSHQLLKSKLEYLKNGKWMVQYAYQNNLREEYDVVRKAILKGYQMQLHLQSQNLDIAWEHPKLLKNLSGKFGLQNQYQFNQTDGRYLIPVYENAGSGLFYLAEWNMNTHTTWEGGLRYDYQWMQAILQDNPKLSTSPFIFPSYRYNAWSGNLGIKKWWNSQLRSSLNLAKAWRPPAMSELFSDGVHGGTVSIERGNRNLKTEQSINTEGELFYQNKRWKITTTVYYYHINNYIYLKPAKELELTIRGAFPVYEYTQVNAHYFGSDLKIEYNWTQKISTDLGYSTVRAYNRNTHQHIELIPSDRLISNIRYKLNERHKFDIGLMHVFKQNRVVATSDLAAIPPAYTLYNTSYWTNVCIGKTEVKLGLTIQNLLNTKYREYLNRFRYYSDDLGRNITLRILLTIK